MTARATLNDADKGPLRLKREKYFYEYCKEHNLSPTDDRLDMFLEGCAFTGQQVCDEIAKMGVAALARSLSVTRRPQRTLGNLFGLLG